MPQKVIKVMRNCLQCNKVFSFYPYEIKHRRFCSFKCYWQFNTGKKRHPLTEDTKQKIGQANKIKMIQLWQNPEYKNHMIKIHIGKKLSEEHKKNISIANKNKPSFRKNTMGTIKDIHGYIHIYKPTHPFCNCRGYIHRSHLIMEKKLGRFIKKGEIIHHINEIRTDDRPENLQLFINRSEHMKYHRNKK